MKHYAPTTRNPPLDHRFGSSLSAAPAGIFLGGYEIAVKKPTLDADVRLQPHQRYLRQRNPTDDHVLKRNGATRVW
jgi:hypothetical protein